MKNYYLMLIMLLLGFSAFSQGAAENLTVTPNGYGVDLSWTDSSTDETGFYVYRRFGGAGDWEIIANLKPDQTSYTDYGLVTSEYIGWTADLRYRVRPYLIDGDGNETLGTFTQLIGLSFSPENPVEKAIEPAADTQIRRGANSEFENISFGDSLFMISKTGNDGLINGFSRLAFVRFDIENITEDVEFADLVLYVSNNVNANESITLYVFDGPPPTWEETGDNAITYDQMRTDYSTNRDEVETVFDLLTDAESEITSYEYAGGDFKGQYISIDVTSFVNENRSTGKLSFMLYDKDKVNKIVNYATKENEDITIRPRLVYRTASTGSIVAPTGLAQTAGMNNLSVDLSWTDDADDTEGYLVERQVGSGEFEMIANLKAGNTTFTDYGIVNSNFVGGTMNYRVSAYNLFQTSDASEAVSTSIVPLAKAIEPTGDTQIRRGASNEFTEVNYGDSLFMIAKTGNDGLINGFSRLAFVKFDVPENLVDAGADDVEYAHLVLNIRDNVDASEPITLYLYEGPPPTWEEGEITYDQMRTDWSSSLEDNEAAFDGLTGADKEIASFEYDGGDFNGQFAVIDITSYFNENRDLSKLSFMLYDKDKANKIVNYNTRENVSAGLRPRIIINDPDAVPLSFEVNANPMLYPNPSTDYLRINASGSFDSGEYKIINLSGALFQKGEFLNSQFEIDIRSLNRGIYLLEMVSGSSKLSYRFIKN